MPDPHAFEMEEEIAEIENRSNNRMLFGVLGGLAAIFLVVIVAYGMKEHARLRAEAARPQTEAVELGEYLGSAGNQAVFATGDGLSYVQLAGQTEITADTRFARPLDYNEAGQPAPAPEGTTHWSLTEADSLPYIIEPIINPLVGFNVDDYRQLDLGSLSRADYGTGGPQDWRPLQMEGTNVTVTGEAARVEGAVYLVSDASRVRLQGIEGLGEVDSLEVEWATANNASLSAFGRIASTPPERGGTALFVMTVTTVHPGAAQAAEPATQ